MKVVWVALPESSTKKQQILESFNYSVYGHTFIVQNKKHYNAWNNYALKREELDWYKYTEGFDAMIQMSGIEPLEDLLKAYPDVKIIIEKLTPVEYYFRFKKIKKIIELLRFLTFVPVIQRSLSMIKKYFYKGFQDDFTQENIETAYSSFLEKVISIVPKQRLLIINQDSSWEKIANFLHEPIPVNPPPLSMGKSRSLEEYVVAMQTSSKQRETTLVILYFLVLIIILLILIYQYA